ncbi:hypothetical protein ACFPIJ_63310 [Dactylosporangium cerinum]|jgi:hypothetical protein|uniref:Uncharacterized protein n=2 Tax=Dactylosporangium TaxID=35753 RepID=A0ABP4L172_9ACTN
MDLKELVRQRRRHQPRPKSWLAAKLHRAEQCRDCHQPWPCDQYVAARNSVLVYALRRLELARPGSLG